MQAAMADFGAQCPIKQTRLVPVGASGNDQCEYDPPTIYAGRAERILWVNCLIAHLLPTPVNLLHVDGCWKITDAVVPLVWSWRRARVPVGGNVRMLALNLKLTSCHRTQTATEQLRKWSRNIGLRYSYNCVWLPCHTHHTWGRLQCTTDERLIDANCFSKCIGWEFAEGVVVNVSWCTGWPSLVINVVLLTPYNFVASVFICKSLFSLFMALSGAVAPGKEETPGIYKGFWHKPTTKWHHHHSLSQFTWNHEEELPRAITVSNHSDTHNPLTHTQEQVSGYQIVHEKAAKMNQTLGSKWENWLFTQHTERLIVNIWSLDHVF